MEKRPHSSTPTTVDWLRATPLPIEPADTTGAGDCFNAGLITGLLTGLEPPEALALGCATGGASTQGVGGTGRATDLTTALALAAQVAVRPGP